MSDLSPLRRLLSPQPETRSPVLFSGTRASITFSVIVFLSTLAQVLVSPIGAFIDARVPWTLPFSFGATLAVLSVACAVQAATLVFSMRAPWVAVIGGMAAYFALLCIVQAPSWLSPMQFVIALALFLLATATRPALTVVWALAVAIVGTAGMLLWASSTGSSPSVVLGFVLSEGARFVLLVLGAAALGILWRYQATRAEAASQKAEAASREHEARVARATDQERARIAQELHDVAGQHLAGLITLADAALTIAPEHPQDALQLVEDVRAEGRFAAASLSGALQDLRAVDTERAEETRDIRRVEELVRYWQERGMRLTWSSGGPLYDLPAVVSAVAYRAASEALTNAAKYAPAAEVRMSVQAGASELSVRVENDPPSIDANVVVGIGLGWGLAAVRERVEMLEGTLIAQTAAEGGWVFAIRIPISGEH